MLETPPPPPVPATPQEPEDPERVWLERVYQHGARQLTPRAVVTGMLIGAVMCLSNLYVVLKTGWSIGVTITACIVAYAVFGVLQKARLAKATFTPLENNAMGSVASAAGYMTGGGNMAALPALILLTGTRPEGPWLMAWFACIAALGVFVAIPVKRQLVNVEQLPFPTGTATAETIRALHGHAGEGAAQAKWLFGSAAAAALLKIVTAIKLLPGSLPLPFSLNGIAASRFTWNFDLSVVLIGGGMIMGFRTGWSLLLGAIVTHGVLVPELVSAGVIRATSFSAILEWTLWTGAAILVSSGILSFAFEWRSVLRAFSELPAVFGRRRVESDDPMSKVEAPAWWFPLGFVLLGPPIVALSAFMFGIPVWVALLTLPLAVVMGFIAARVTGETDVTPTKALGPVTQMTYGALVPGNVVANVMGANVTGGVGLHAADLLTDLKSGFLLGANPRQQFFAQMFGVVAGAVVVVPAFYLLVPTADVLGSTEFPAPAAQVWAGVSRVLSAGFNALEPTARVGAAIGLVIGAALTLLERYLPKKGRAFVPSAAGLGIAMVMPASNAIAFFIGATLAEYLRRRHPVAARATVLPVGSGLIAGESLMGVVVAGLVAAGLLAR